MTVGELKEIIKNWSNADTIYVEVQGGTWSLYPKKIEGTDEWSHVLQADCNLYVS